MLKQNCMLQAYVSWRHGDHGGVKSDVLRGGWLLEFLPFPTEAPQIILSGTRSTQSPHQPLLHLLCRSCAPLQYVYIYIDVYLCTHIYTINDIYVQYIYIYIIIYI